VLGLDVWDGSATQLALYREITDVSFPLLMRASREIGLMSKGAIDALVVVDQAGVVRFRSSRSRPEVDSALLVIGSLLDRVRDSSSADFDGDGLVNFQDFLLFAEAFGSVDLRFDLDQSGRIDFADFLAFARIFGTF